MNGRKVTELRVWYDYLRENPSHRMSVGYPFVQFEQTYTRDVPFDRNHPAWQGLMVAVLAHHGMDVAPGADYGRRLENALHDLEFHTANGTIREVSMDVDKALEHWLNRSAALRVQRDYARLSERSQHGFLLRSVIMLCDLLEKAHIALAGLVTNQSPTFLLPLSEEEKS